MELASPGVRVIARYHYFLPALAVCTVGALLGGWAGASVLYLSHGLFAWGAYGALRGADDPSAASTLARLPAQWVVLLLIGILAALLLGGPGIYALREPGLIGYSILAVGALAFLVIGLRVWPSLGVLYVGDVPDLSDGILDQAVEAPGMGLALTRGHLERAVEGAPWFVGFALVALTPFVLALAGWGPGQGLYWGVIGAAFLLGAPLVYGYLVAEVVTLLEAVTPEGEPSVPKPQPSTSTPLENLGITAVEAARAGDLAALEQLRATGADLDQIEDGLTPLVAATGAPLDRRPETIEWLLAAGVNVETTDEHGRTALHHAAARNDLAGISLLLEAGARVDSLDKERKSPLAAACAEGHWDAAQALLDAGAEAEPEGAAQPLHEAAMASSDEPSGVRLLLDNGAKVDSRGKLGRTALLGAAMKGNAMVVEALLEAGADINTQDQFGNTALMEAARAGANGVLERLVLWKPDTELRDKPGRTALIVAVSSRRAGPETVRLLLAMGADPNVRNREGRAAGELAAAAGRWRIARALGMEVPAAPDGEREPASAPVQAGPEAEGPRIIDLEAFETEQDREWAGHQLEKRSRTQLQSAEAPSEEPEVDDREAEVESEPPEGPEADAQVGDLDSVAEIDFEPHETPAPESESSAETEPEPTSATDRSASEAAASASEERDESRVGYKALMRAATRDDLEQMEMVLDHENDIPEWWLSSAFLNAVAAGRVIAPRWLLEHGLNPNATSEAGMPLLTCIARRSPPNLDILEALLDQGARPDADPFLLHWLAGRSDDQPEGAPGGLDAEEERRLAEFVGRLIEGGADPAARDAEERTALHWAALCRHPVFVEKLIEHGAPVRARDHQGNTPLMLAATAERTGTARVLVRHGADPKATNEKGSSALSVAVERQDQTLMKLLMAGESRPAKPKSPPRPEDLIGAAGEGNLGRVKRLISGNTDLDVRDSEGCTALLRAAGRGHADVVSALLSAGANPDIAANNGTTPLGAAVLGNHAEIANLLCDRGVDADQRQRYGITPLMLAAARWQPRMVVSLLRYDADPNARDETEGTPLMAAVQNALHSDDIDAGAATIKFLLKAGADPDASNDEGQTPLMLLLGVRARTDAKADERHLKRLASMLIEHGAQVDRQDLTGWSALHAAASHGFRDTAALLMDSGASRRLRDINGLSPVDLAMDNAHDALVDLFIQRG